jgi:hypothetical protein
MKHTFENTTVNVTAAGIDTQVDVTKFDPASIQYMFEYGVRRAFQDNINSKAHAAKKKGEPFDAQAAFDARLEQAVSGDMLSRGEGAGYDEMDLARISVARGIITHNKDAKGKPTFAKDKAAYDAIPSKEQAARAAFLLEWAQAKGEAVDKLARNMIAQREAMESLSIG